MVTYCDEPSKQLGCDIALAEPRDVHLPTDWPGGDPINRRAVGESTMSIGDIHEDVTMCVNYGQVPVQGEHGVRLQLTHGHDLHRSPLCRAAICRTFVDRPDS